MLLKLYLETSNEEAQIEFQIGTCSSYIVEAKPYLPSIFFGNTQDFFLGTYATHLALHSSLCLEMTKIAYTTSRQQKDYY